MSLFKSAKKKFQLVRSANRFSSTKLNQDKDNESINISLHNQQRHFSLPGISSTGLEETIKKKPSGYLFLLKTNPLIDWNEIDSFDLLKESLDTEEPIHHEEKLFINKAKQNLAHCKIFDKFSDDHFDEYLFEMGILDDCYPKFDDFMNEIELLRSCNQSNIIKFYDAYYYESKLWILTEYCSIGSIEKLLTDLARPFNQIQIQYIVKEVLNGLNYLNEKCHIVHGDLKPANLMISDDLTIKISNFCVAAKNNRLKGEEKRYIFINSPHYIAPEVLKFEKTLSDLENTLKSDVWSLGIICIELAEGQPPFSEYRPDAVIDEINYAKQSPCLNKSNKWSSSFHDFLSKCLDRNSDNRFSASMLLEHDFMKNFNSNKSEIQNLLNERKIKLYTSTRQSIDDLEHKISEMNLLKDQPEHYVYNFVQDIKSLIDQKAEEAKKKIEKDHEELLSFLDNYKNECLSNLSQFRLSDFNQVDILKQKYDEKYQEWNSILSARAINEFGLKTAENEANQISKICENELNVLKSNLFVKKNLQFESIEQDMIKFGCLNSKNEFGSHINRINTNENLNVKEANLIKKPIHKLIRFELKQNRKKSYF